MRVTMTLRTEAFERDVEVVADGAATAGQLAPLFAELMSGTAAGQLSSGGEPLPEQARLGEPGLRSGCVITLAGTTKHTSLAGSALQLRVVGGPDSGKAIGLPRGRHLIGRDCGAGLQLGDPQVSRRHAELRVGLGGISVRDLDSTNGTWLNGTRVTAAGRPVESDTVLRMGNSLVRVVFRSEQPAAVSPDPAGGLLVHRPPRLAEPVEEGPVEFPAEPVATARPRLQWLGALVPAVFGVGCAIALRNAQFLAFAVLSPVTLLAGAAVDRRDWRRGQRQARAEHLQAEAAAREQLDTRLVAENAALHRDLPDAATVLLAAATPDCRLWERRREERCFLEVRLGIADRPADTRATRAGRLLPAELITGAPTTARLREGPLGLAGPLPLARGAARWVVGQLLALHSPQDVSVVALLDGEIADWRWLRWARAAVRAIGTEPEGHRLLLQELLGIIADRRARNAGGVWAGSWIVVLVDRPSGLTSTSGLQTVLEQGAAVGVSALCVDSEDRLLPPACRSTAVLRAGNGAELELRRAGRPPVRLVADRVSEGWADQLSRCLAPLHDIESTAAVRLPSQVWLADLLDAEELSAEWLRRRWAAPASAATPIGMAATGPVEFDLLRDGPHLLIAGTTGAGKSELLRSFVTGLAMRDAPDDLAFVLIDYKGGAAFAGCAGFPHTVGLVTDLDAHLTSRALASLEAELRRREATLAEAGVADLEAYRRTPAHRRRRLARLVLVVDEFAYLAEELPTFLSGLIGVAQRGRSLGLHLVLATQRPAGVVSPQIKANISSRIALRVTDAADSADVIGSDAASHLPRDRPGRAVARLADGLVEFQAARIGRRSANRSVTVTPLDAWHRTAATSTVPAADGLDELERLRGAMLAAAARLGRPLPERPWLPPLPARLTTTELDHDRAAPFQIRFGLTDDPGRQRQQAASHDLLAGGAVGFIGSPRSGRTSALHTFLGQACRQLDAGQLHLYVLDLSGQSFSHLARLPHCGAVVGRDDPNAVARLVARLVEELGIRQRQLAHLGVGTVAEAYQIGAPLPTMVVAVDGWEGFAALSDDHDAGRSAEALLGLARDGAAAGITVLIAGDRAMLGLRVAPVLARRIVLALTDRSDYASAGIHAASLSVRFEPGRAVDAGDGLELQLALLTDDARPGSQQAALVEFARTDPVTAAGPTIRVRSLPTLVRRADLHIGGSDPRGPEHLPEGDHDAPAGHPGSCLLGLGGDDARPVWSCLFAEHARFLVCGPALSGRSTTMVAIAQQALRAGLAMLVAAPLRSPLADWGARQGLAVLTPDGPSGSQSCDFPGQLVVIDDAEQFTDTDSGIRLTELVTNHPGAVVAAARTEELMSSFRGPAVAVRRSRTGLLLQPGPADGELLGVRTGGRRMPLVPGRGLLITDSTRRTAPDGLVLQVAI
ncbi:MAG: segregation ATPase FtsK/SpoIIIE, family [Pseudonocardiales bacterium]|nr:segregation ATPase FtsK/SpoIIIE, family [Pseudonocardiales bacterium]